MPKKLTKKQAKKRREKLEYESGRRVHMMATYFAYDFIYGHELSEMEDARCMAEQLIAMKLNLE